MFGVEVEASPGERFSSKINLISLPCQPMHINISPQLQAALDKRSQETGQTPAEIVTIALREYLEIDEETLFQTSTIGALVEGVYRGDLTIAELKNYGDFGLGTFNDLDGEMVVLDGQVWQLRADGRAYPVAEEVKTPFATVTFWQADWTATLDQPLTYEELQRYLDTLLPSGNIFYAIKISGQFRSVRTRTIERQTQPTRLVAAAARQPVHEFSQVQGDLIGFWTPSYMKTVNVPGYHFHFLSADRQQGGHVLDVCIDRVDIGIDDTPRLRMALPATQEFLEANLTRDTEQELHQAEK